MLLLGHESHRLAQIMKTALTIWEGRISPVFDTARVLVLVEIGEGKVTPLGEAVLMEGSEREKTTQLHSLGVEALVCGAVSRPLADMIISSGIRLHPFVAGKVEEVLEALAADKMPDAVFPMPGCVCRLRRRMRGCRGGRHHGTSGGGGNWA